MPGLTRLHAARAAWLRQQIGLAVDGEGCRQVVLLRAGLSTWAWALAQPGVRVRPCLCCCPGRVLVGGGGLSLGSSQPPLNRRRLPPSPPQQFFEVDSREAIARKKALLDGTLPPYWRSAATRPLFVEADAATPAGRASLIPQLTGAGFDPRRPACIVAEGLLPYLPADAVASLMADLSALVAPGSRLLFDFVHASALEALGTGNDAPPGLANLAAAAAAKGAPLRSGQPACFSGAVGCGGVGESSRHQRWQQAYAEPPTYRPAQPGPSPVQAWCACCRPTTSA